ncbi:MAG TPA: acylphosphatase [bacterium]|nr:acylphosphatase [bacterium]
MAVKSYKAVIKGIVQGVNFRNFTKLEADRIGIKGYVRNTADGHVEAFLEGEEDLIREIVSIVHTGPLHSTVNEVKLYEQKNLSNFKDFKVIR